MSLWIDTLYLKQISYRLDGYVLKKDGDSFLANCRCPICGDSQKNTSKKRGYFFVEGEGLLYKCWNCGISMSFDRFLKDFDFPLHDVYRMEKFKDSSGRTSYTSRQVKNEPAFDLSSFVSSKKKEKSFFDGTAMMDILPETHEAKRYLTKRKIPAKFISDMSYAERFFSWASTNTDKFTGTGEDHPRIIIPWRNEDGKIFAYQARSLHGEEPKYYTIIMDEEYPKVFGLDRVDYTSRIYVVEGPVDSMFIKNAVAVGSSALFNYTTKKTDVVYCFDNEKRNLEIVKLMDKTVGMGYNVFIPPDHYTWKDINDAVEKGGYSSSELKELIDSNTFSGLSAKVRFDKWKRR